MSIFKTIANKLFAVTDGVNDRAAMGNLDSYTGPNGVVSPAQYGFRAIDDQGNAIFDSLGLIGVMSYLGGSALQSADTVVSTTASPIGSGVFFIFSLSRAAHVIIAARSLSKTAGAGGTFAYVEVYIDGVFDGNCHFLDKGNPGFTCGTCTAILTTARLAAGQHRVELLVRVDSGQTWTNAASSFQLFLAGA